MKIAKLANMTAAQLSLSWAIQKGMSVIPKSANAERIYSNLERKFACIDIAFTNSSQIGLIK